jgi:hypothetical protein
MMGIGVFGIDDSHDYSAAYFFSVAMMTVWTGTVAIFPAAIAIAIGEAFAWRSALYYALAGGVIALIADQLSGLVIEPSFFGHRTVIMLAGGFVGGFVYWAIAGRLAGDWGTGNTPQQAPIKSKSD